MRAALARPRKETPDPLRLYVLKLALAALCGAFLCGDAVAAPPTLSHVFPAGGQRGSTVQAKCSDKTAWPVKVWSPGIDVEVGDEEGQLSISIPDNLAADRVWIRLYNDEGASAAVPFVIGSLAEIEEAEPNNALGEAQTVEASGVTINGVLHKRGEVDAFAVDVSVGETLVAAVDANTRLGSPMDAILQVVTLDGIVLAENHDDIGLDPRLAYTARESGTHIVRLFAFPSEPTSQIAYAGGDDYVYRLMLTTGPYITHAAEMPVCREDACSIEVRGWNIPPDTKLPVAPFGGVTGVAHRELEREAQDGVQLWPNDRLGLAYTQGFAGAARIRLVSFSPATQLADSDPSGLVTLKPPTSIAECIAAPGESDEFRVFLTKGQEVVIAVESQNLHLPLVPAVRLTDPDGIMVAETRESGPARDAELAHQAAQDGSYALSVSDRFGQGGERYAYRLTIREAAADFVLSTETDAIVVKPDADKPTELKVKIDRRSGPSGAVGPVMIEAVDLPPGVAAEAVVSQPEGPTAKEVTLKLTSTGKAYSGPIRIRGTAAEPHVFQRFAHTPTKLGATFESIWLTAAAKP